MTHDNTAAVIPKFKAVAKRIFLPQQPVFALGNLRHWTLCLRRTAFAAS